MTRATRLGRALGPSIALWAVVPLLLRRAAPGASWPLVVALGVVGVVAHLGCRYVSNRAWFAGPRSPLALVVASLTVAATVAAAVAGAAVVAHAVADTGDEVDVLLLGAAWVTATIGLGSAFTGRVEFRGWLLHHAAVRARTRPFATAPIGPDRASVLDLVEDLAADDDAAVDLEALGDRLRMSADERFRRHVPWATARPLLAAAARHTERTSGTSVHVDLDEDGVETPVVIGGIVDLVHELAATPGVRRIAVTAESRPATGAGRAGDSIVLRVVAAVDGDQRPGLRISTGTARALDRHGAVVADGGAAELTVTTAFTHEPDPVDVAAIEATLSARVELLAESPFSDGARRVYRRGDAVVKVQRHDRFDPKPTLLEDEFHVLRRLQGRSSRFPSPIGYGIERGFSWIAYEYVEGRPLDAWLADHRAQAPARLLSFGVDLTEMLDELAAARVAHRDLNPGNLIVDETGGLVLIDFDQGASGMAFVDADRAGVEAGLAKNDLVEFLERATLTRAANELLAALDEAWPATEVPFSLGVLGRRFGDGWPIDPLLSSTRARLGPLDGCRVLDLHRTVPVAGLLLASAGADVTAVVDEPDRWSRVADLVGPTCMLVGTEPDDTASFDLTVAIGAGAGSRSPVGPGSTVLVERTAERTGQTTGRPPWFTTTVLTQLGPAGP